MFLKHKMAKISNYIFLLFILFEISNGVRYCACITDSSTEKQCCSTIRCMNRPRLQLTPIAYCDILEGIICKCNGKNCYDCGCHKTEPIYINRVIPVEVPVYYNTTIQVPVSHSCTPNIVYLNRTTEVPVIINNTIILNNSEYDNIYINNNCTGLIIIDKNVKKSDNDYFNVFVVFYCIWWIIKYLFDSIYLS